MKIILVILCFLGLGFKSLDASAKNKYMISTYDAQGKEVTFEVCYDWGDNMMNVFFFAHEGNFNLPLCNGGLAIIPLLENPLQVKGVGIKSLEANAHKYTVQTYNTSGAKITFDVCSRDEVFEGGSWGYGFDSKFFNLLGPAVSKERSLKFTLCSGGYVVLPSPKEFLQISKVGFKNAESTTEDSDLHKYKLYVRNTHGEEIAFDICTDIPIMRGSSGLYVDGRYKAWFPTEYIALPICNEGYVAFAPKTAFRIVKEK